jgi:long-subunit acyl-CoA synthetase (AMP-forming)
MNLPKYVPPAATVRELISQHARLQPNTVYAVFPETQTVLTYQDLEQEVQEYVTQFHALGLVQGDTVSFMMGNGKTALMLFLSALYTGLIISPLNPAAGPEQIAYVLQHSDTKVVFISAASKSVVVNLEDKLPKGIQLIDAHEDHGPSWAKAFVSAIKLASITAQNDALLMYTSGTTGRPKGVVLTHENLIAGV